MRTKLPILAAILLLLAACGAGSRPFQHEGVATQRLVAPPEGLSVFVETPANGTPEAARALAAALRLAEVPASTEYGTTAGYRLVGASEPGITIWRLLANDGKVLTEARSPDMSDVPDDPEPGFHTAAAEIAAVVRGHQTADLPGGAPSSTPQKLHLAAAAGAPGDGARALPLAMRSALADMQIELVDTAAADAFTLTPQVTLGPADGDVQPIEILWVLSRDGEEIGSLAQRNAVPAGSLDERWGATAVLAARAAAPGVSELIAAALR